MPTAYDPYDSDESLPTSPKPKFRKPLRLNSRQIIGHIRRSRFLIFVSLGLFVVFYYFKHYHRHLFPLTHAPSIRYKNVDWRYYAYSQYATDSHYLCNSLMVFEALERLGSRAERILMYPEEWDIAISNTSGRDSQLLAKARDTYGVKLLSVKVQRFERNAYTDTGGDEVTWDTSLTKFLAFNQTQFLRIIHLDSDVTVQQHMDELFLLPSSPVAMTRAYWSPTVESSLTSLFILLEPSTTEFARLMGAAESKSRKADEFDMEILNDLYGKSAMVLPHRKYGLLSGEFRSPDHEAYLGNNYEKWNPKRALHEASLVHFSDWPLPKPWIMWPHNLLREKVPKCEISPGTANEAGCENREIWLELYNNFRRRRKDICALLSVPAPEWPPRKKDRRE